MTNAEYLRSLRQRAAERGLCYVCRCRPAEPGLRTCRVCLDKGAEQTRRATAEGKRTGKRCTSCGAHKRKDGYRTCATCRRRSGARVDVMKAAGICTSCPYPAAPGHTMCQVHLDRLVERARRRRAGGEEAGSGRVGLPPVERPL